MGEKLTQSENSIFIEGTCNKIEFKTDKDSNLKDYIAGTYFVRVDGDSIVPISVFSYKYKHNGDQNKVYKGLKTVMKEHRSEITHGEDADRVRVGGEIRVEEFYTKGGELVNRAKYSSNFFNRSNEGDENNNQAVFRLEIIVENLREEIINDEETGRGFIDGMTVDYGGNLKPVTVVVGEKLWNQFEQKLDVGEVLICWGDILNTVKKEVFKLEADFGEDNERVITRTTKELLVTGAKYSDKEYDGELIEKARVDRAKYLKGLKVRAIANVGSNVPKQDQRNAVKDESELPGFMQDI